MEPPSPEAIFETSHNAFVSMDERGRVTYWNARAEQMFGYPREDVDGTLLADTIIPPRLRARHRDGLRRFLETGAGPILDKPVELVAQRRDGSELAVQLTVSATRRPQGWMFHALIQDLSERAPLLARLKTIAPGSEPDFAAILDVLAEAVTIRDRDDRIIYANRAALVDMGFDSLSEIQSRAPASIMADYIVLDERGGQLTLDDIPSVRLLRGQVAEPLLMQSLHRATGMLQWKLLKATPLRDPAGEIVATVTIIEDVTVVKTAELRSRFLAEASEILASSLDYQQTLRNVGWSAVPTIADWCAVDLVDEKGARERVVVAHRDPEMLGLAERLRAYEPAQLDPERGLGKVVRTGLPELYAEIPGALLEQSATDDEHLTLLRQVRMRSVLLVPIRTSSRTLGVMTLVMAESQRTFSWGDVDFAVQLGARAAMAVDNARLYRDRVEIAETLQRSLLPETVPEIPGWEVAALYRPAGADLDLKVGGDFYDLLKCDDGWIVVIGDVTGKGLAAATVASFVRHCAMFSARRDPRPAAILADIDEALKQRGRLSLCTALCLRITQADVVVSSAGHPMPLIVAADGRVRVGGSPGILLGTLEPRSWHEETLALAPGETLLIYTDGVTDTRGEHERFGETRLRELLAGRAGSTPEELLSALDAALGAFQAGPQSDDTAAVAVAPAPLRTAGAAGEPVLAINTTSDAAAGRARGRAAYRSSRVRVRWARHRTHSTSASSRSESEPWSYS